MPTIKGVAADAHHLYGGDACEWDEQTDMSGAPMTCPRCSPRLAGAS